MPPPSGMVSRGSISDGRPFPGMGGVLLVLDDNATIHLLEASTRSVITELGTLPAGFLPEGPKRRRKRIRSTAAQHPRVPRRRWVPELRSVVVLRRISG